MRNWCDGARIPRFQGRTLVGSTLSGVLLPAPPSIPCGDQAMDSGEEFLGGKKRVTRLPVGLVRIACRRRVIHRVSGGVEGRTHVRNCEFQYGFDERVFRMVR